jgi:hypothetical protein
MKKDKKKKSMKELTKKHAKVVRRKEENPEGLEDFEKVLEELVKKKENKK